MVFLQTLTESGIAEVGILGFFAAFFMFAFILILGVYIYTSFAFMAIAKKAKYSKPGIAWIPGIGPLLITSKTAKMHWWPILLLVLSPIPFIGGIASIAVAVFSIIWLWKTFEVIGKPGWWAILTLLPIVNFVILGIAAWSKN